ncbi:related to Dolichyl-diphosphooligosaccharide--protein glycosyltransferase subunit SWP1 [Zygosaccharomyces bailii ISA1307]|nr:related to Dolichyl-diphosphooligosaccharide--protein glycosyltransferase subunit SWP1 [Zygosaccharomyces bailii ISA1307]
MQLLKALSLFAIATLGQAFTVKDVHFAFPDTSERGIMVGSINSNSDKLERPIKLDTLDQTIELNFASDARLSQATLLLGLPDIGLEQAIQATLTENQGLLLYRFRIPVNQLSQRLLHAAVNEGKLLTGSVVLAESGDGMLSTFFDLEFDVNETVAYTKPDRFEAEPEIYHVFKPEPQTVSWAFAQIFSFAIVVATLGLVISWMSAGALRFGSVPRGLNFIYFLAFIGSVMGFEFIFASYYTGTSIFDTLKHAFLLSIPALLLSTKFLRSFGKELH